MKRKIDPMTVVLDVSGGVVQAVFSDLPLKLVLVDWDNIKDGSTPVPFGCAPLDSMTEDTRLAALEVIAPTPKEVEDKLEKIRKAAVEDLVEACRGDAGYRWTVLEDYVNTMTVQIDQIKDDDEAPLLARLGFDPNPLADLEGTAVGTPLSFNLTADVIFHKEQT